MPRDWKPRSSVQASHRSQIVVAPCVTGYSHEGNVVSSISRYATSVLPAFDNAPRSAPTPRKPVDRWPDVKVDPAPRVAMTRSTNQSRAAAWAEPGKRSKVIANVYAVCV